MPKLKTSRAAAKRFKRLASGVYKCKGAFDRHILTKKSSKRKRHLGAMKVVHKSDTGLVARLLRHVSKS